MKRDMFINIVSSTPLSDTDTGRSLLLALSERAQLTPDVYGNWEPLKKKFDRQDIEKVLEDWQHPFLWKRRRPFSEGYVGFASKGTCGYAGVSLSADGQNLDAGQVIDLFVTWSSYLRCDFGLLHLLTNSEIERGVQSRVARALNSARTEFILLVTIHELVRYLPDLYWATVFGPAYLSHFGKDRVLSAPAYRVRQIGPDNVYLQLSENITDLDKDPAKVERVREAVKKHLGESSFFDPALGKDYPYSTPWPAPPAPANEGMIAARSAKDDCDSLMKEMLPVAQTMLEEYGEFYPYGGKMRTDGTIEQVSAYDGKKRPRPRDLIDLLTGAFREDARQGHIRACAIVCNVDAVPPGGKEKASAIQVRLDHIQDYSVEVYLPYRIAGEHRVEMGEAFTRAGAHSIFLHR